MSDLPSDIKYTIQFDALYILYLSYLYHKEIDIDFNEFMKRLTIKASVLVDGAIYKEVIHNE